MAEVFEVFDHIDINNDVVRLRVDFLVDHARCVDRYELVAHCEWMSITEAPKIGTQDYDMVRLLIMCSDVGLAPALDCLTHHYFSNVPHIDYEELTLEG